MSQNSYLREFCVQVSQIVFLTDLTVLRLISTVWAKMSQNSYLRQFCAQVSQIVFSWFDCFAAYYNCLSKMSQNSYLREFCAQVSQIVFLADLTVLWLITTVWAKCHQTHISASSVHRYQQIVFLADFTVLRLITTVWAKCHKTHISASSVHKYHKSCS